MPLGLEFRDYDIINLMYTNIRFFSDSEIIFLGIPTFYPLLLYYYIFMRLNKKICHNCMTTDVPCYLGLRGWESKRRAWTHIKGWKEAKKYFDCMSGSWCVCQCECVSLLASIHVYVCMHVSLPVAVAGVGQKRLFLHIFKQQHSSVQQDPADDGNARGCQGGGEESHCFKETRHNCRAAHLIQARASTLQLSMASKCSVYGFFGKEWFLYSLPLHFLFGANKRSEEVTIAARHAA